MAFRDIQRARPGQLYASPWIEWTAICRGCGAMDTAVTLADEAANLRQAQQRAQDNARRPLQGIFGWRYIRGAWYCQGCAHDIPVYRRRTVPGDATGEEIP